MMMTPEPTDADPVVAAAPAHGPRSRELDLFAFAFMLLSHLWFILGCGVLAFLVEAGLMLHAKPRYAATAVMIVPQGNITSSALQAQLSLSTIDLLGGGYELYADILRSRRIADVLIKDAGLQKVYGTANLEDAEATLASLTNIVTQREGVVRVTVEDTDPQRAADLANDYLLQLDILNQSLVLSSVKEQRVYLENEMIKEKDALADAEVSLKEVQESTNGLAPEAQANAGMNALESTRATLRADEIHLASLLTGETEANPEVVRLKREIAGLNGQLNALENGSASAQVGTPTSRVPAETLEYTRRLREVKFHESLFDLLEKQFEDAKLQEARTPSIVQVLDKARPSKHKAWPPRSYYCIMAGIAGTIVGLLLIALRGVVMAYVRNPSNAEKLRQLKNLYLRQLRMGR